MSVEPELKVQMELEAHEKECALRYQMVEQRLSELSKRLWRLEAMSMGSTATILVLAATLILKL